MAHHKRPRPYDDDHYRHPQRPYNDYGNDSYHRPSKKQQRRGEPHHNDSPRHANSHHSSSTPLPAELPTLPTVATEYSTAPFTHRSAASESRSVVGAKHVTYERLEFVGDAYIEMFASDLILDRFPHLPTGQMSQLREMLVKNETLAEYSRAYQFDQRVSVVDLDRMKADGANKGNKGFNKILGDIFEAYVGAVVRSAPTRHQGLDIAEKWVTALWEPKLRDAVKQDKNYSSDVARPESSNSDPRKTYNDQAKALLQKRIMNGGSEEKKLSYETWKDSVELKGDKLGQNRHFIALYLTGYGYDKKLLGKGEGKNKVEAGNWAAIEAMYGDCKHIVDQCEKMSRAEREKRAAERKKANERYEKDAKERLGDVEGKDAEVGREG